MTDATIIAPEAEASELIVLEPGDQLAILTNSERFDAFYKHVAQLVEAHVPDVTTKKGRTAIASLARKVVTTKTTLDAAGKALTDESRKQIATVDEARRNIRTKLDALRDRARAPLTVWEEAEEARQARVSKAIQFLKDAAVITTADTEETVADRLFEVTEFAIDPAEFQEMEVVARSLVDQARTALTTAASRLKQEAADRAELEKLRQERAERAAADAAAEAARLETARREQAEAERKAAIEKAAADAAAKAKKEAADKAARDKERVARQHQEALDAEKRRADEAEAKAKADREAAEKAIKDEADAKAAREADLANRDRVLSEAATAIHDATGVNLDHARVVLDAIARGLIPNVAITF